MVTLKRDQHEMTAGAKVIDSMKQILNEPDTEDINFHKPPDLSIAAYQDNVQSASGRATYDAMRKYAKDEDPSTITQCKLVDKVSGA